MFGGLTTLLAAEVSSAARQQFRAIAWMVAGALFGLGALGAGIVALHQWLVTFMTGLQATLWIMAGLLVIAATCFIVGMMVKNAKRDRSGLRMAALALTPAATRMAFRNLNLPAIGVGGAIALGAILGRKLGR